MTAHVPGLRLEVPCRRKEHLSGRNRRTGVDDRVAHGNKAPISEVKQLYLRAVADLALEAGSLLLACGAAAAEVERAMLAVAEKAGIEQITVDVTFSEITFSYRRADDLPYTRIHGVRSRTFDYGKMTDITHLVELFCRQRTVSTNHCLPGRMKQ